jgi:hypothetical protein
VHFSEVLAGGANALVRGAQAAVRALPGSPLMALAVRGGGAGVPVASTELSAPRAALPGSRVGLAAGVTPEGPGGVAAVGVGPTAGVAAGSGGGAGAASADGGLESSLAQAQELNMYYLQIQEEVNAQNRTFTALSNVLEVEHNTAKSAIGNIH